MANGKVFNEIREIVEGDKDMTTKGSLRLILAGMADMHDKDEAWRASTEHRLKKIESVTQHPSALWYLANMPLKTLAVFTVVLLIMVVIFMPEARAWALESLVKTFLGGL